MGKLIDNLFKIPQFLFSDPAYQESILNKDPDFADATIEEKQRILGEIKEARPQIDESGAGFGTRARLSFAATPELVEKTLRKDYGKNNVVNIPGQGLAYRETDKDTFKLIDEPGLTWGDVADGIGYAPELILGTVGEVIGGRYGGMKGMAAGSGFGSAIGEGIRGVGGEMMGVAQGDPSDEMARTAHAALVGTVAPPAAAGLYKGIRKIVAPYRSKRMPEVQAIKDQVLETWDHQVEFTPGMMVEAQLIRLGEMGGRLGIRGKWMEDFTKKELEALVPISNRISAQWGYAVTQGISPTDVGQPFYDLFGPLIRHGESDLIGRPIFSPANYLAAKTNKDTIIDVASDKGVKVDITDLLEIDPINNPVPDKLKAIGIDPDAILSRSTKKGDYGKRYILEIDEAFSLKTQLGALAEEISQGSKSNVSKLSITQINKELVDNIAKGLDVFHGVEGRGYNLMHQWARNNEVFSEVFKDIINNKFMRSLVEQGYYNPELIPSLLKDKNAVTQIRHLKKALLHKRWGESVTFTKDEIAGRKGVIATGPERPFKESDVTGEFQFLGPYHPEPINPWERHLYPEPRVPAQLGDPRPGTPILHEPEGFRFGPGETGQRTLPLQEVRAIDQTRSAVLPFEENAMKGMPARVKGVDLTGLDLDKAVLQKETMANKKVWNLMQFRGYYDLMKDAGIDKNTGFTSGKGILEQLDTYDPQVLEELWGKGTVKDVRLYGEVLEALQAPGIEAAESKFIGAVGIKLMQFRSIINIVTAMIPGTQAALTGSDLLVAGIPLVTAKIFTSKKGQKWLTSGFDVGTKRFKTGPLHEKLGVPKGMNIPILGDADEMRRSLAFFTRAAAVATEWDNHALEWAKDFASNGLGLSKDSVTSQTIPGKAFILPGMEMQTQGQEPFAWIGPQWSTGLGYFQPGKALEQATGWGSGPDTRFSALQVEEPITGRIYRDVQGLYGNKE